MKSPRLNELDLDQKVTSKKEYRDELAKLERVIFRIQRALYLQQKRAIVVFEGWDAAGKGGTIRRMTKRLDPRGFQVHAIGAPTPEEQGKHYLYRFWKRLPKVGSLAIFDRSWYGRVLVERVEHLVQDEAWRRAYQEINEFEAMLVDDGVKIVKIFFHISKEEQRQRFLDRLEDPLKRWKLTEEDLRNREKWDDYVEAADEMLAETSTKKAKWHVIASNQKKFSRIAAMRAIRDELCEIVDLNAPIADPDWIEKARSELEKD